MASTASAITYKLSISAYRINEGESAAEACYRNNKKSCMFVGSKGGYIDDELVYYTVFDCASRVVKASECETGLELIGGIVARPEFAFWFEDVGFGVENYGTDPDEVVRFGPEDYAAGRDPQLARAVEQALELLESTPAAPPDFDPVPNLGRPS